MAFHQNQPGEENPIKSGTLDAPNRYAGEDNKPQNPPAPPSEVPGENRVPEKFPEKGAKLNA